MLNELTSTRILVFRELYLFKIRSIQGQHRWLLFYNYDFIIESGIRFSTFKSVGIAIETGPCLFGCAYWHWVLAHSLESRDTFGPLYDWKKAFVHLFWWLDAWETVRCDSIAEFAWRCNDLYASSVELTETFNSQNACYSLFNYVQARDSTLIQSQP